jgi:SSS family solute:Na+ symporter
VIGTAQTKVISTMDPFITRIDRLDLAVIGAYFLIVFVIGAYLARRTHSADDLILAGRRLGWLPIGFSLFASNISSTTLIGLMGAAYTRGIAVANYEWMAAPLRRISTLTPRRRDKRGESGAIPIDRRMNRPVWTSL